jgi:hypothetical protein
MNVLTKVPHPIGRIRTIRQKCEKQIHRSFQTVSEETDKNESSVNVVGRATTLNAFESQTVQKDSEESAVLKNSKKRSRFNQKVKRKDPPSDKKGPS